MLEGSRSAHYPEYVYILVMLALLNMFGRECYCCLNYIHWNVFFQIQRKDSRVGGEKNAGTKSLGPASHVLLGLRY